MQCYFMSIAILAQDSVEKYNLPFPLHPNGLLKHPNLVFKVASHVVPICNESRLTVEIDCRHFLYFRK
jgi:hypothetical protein